MIEEWLWGFEVWVKASEVPAEPEMSYGIELIANKWSGVLLYRSKFDMTLYLIWCWREGIWAPSHTAVKFHLIIFDSNLAINIKILKRSKLTVPATTLWDIYNRKTVVHSSREITNKN